MTWFDESRLDDERALSGVDPQLRGLAESGARLRRAAVQVAEDAAVARALADDLDRPRAVVLHGPGAGLLRAVLEPICGAPVVVWDRDQPPGWVGGLDLVVVLAPAGAPDAVAAATVASAVRRGCRLLTVCGPGSPVADQGAGRWSSVLRTDAGEPSVVALLALAHLADGGLAPPVDPEDVAAALDGVAEACSPYREAGVNPAKLAAAGLGETLPLVSPRTDSPLGVRAAEQGAGALRRLVGLPVLAGGPADIGPVLEASVPRTVFDDPYDDDSAGTPRPSLLLVGEHEAPDSADAAGLRVAADARGVRVVELDAPPAAPLAAHAAVVLRATYAAAYLRLGTVDGPR